MKERKKLTLWMKEHKRQIVTASVSAGILTLTVLGIKNREAIETIWNSYRSDLKRMSAKIPEAVPTNAVPTNAVSTGSIVAFPTPTLDDAIDKSVKRTTPYPVKGHPRNLPSAWHASQAKKDEAQNLGIQLKENQTWVFTYMKNQRAA